MGAFTGPVKLPSLQTGLSARAAGARARASTSAALNVPATIRILPTIASPLMTLVSTNLRPAAQESQPATRLRTVVRRQRGVGPSDELQTIETHESYDATMA